MNDDNSTGKTEKLLIDNSSDFGFHVAYLAYSKAWDENVDNNARNELNTLISELAKKKEDYETFYQKINGFRQNQQSDYPERNRFKAQNKRAWRQSEAKKERISRHKK
jgi:hypothetical protein